MTPSDNLVFLDRTTTVTPVYAFSRHTLRASTSSQRDEAACPNIDDLRRRAPRRLGDARQGFVSIVEIYDLRRVPQLEVFRAYRRVEFFNESALEVGGFDELEYVAEVLQSMRR